MRKKSAYAMWIFRIQRLSKYVKAQQNAAEWGRPFRARILVDQAVNRIDTHLWNTRFYEKHHDNDLPF
jgi:hypothetical protein